MVSSADILNAKILAVDDKQANVLLLQGMLRVAGYTSVEATTEPDKVCELHCKNRYDLILLDLQMPGMDGFEVMEGLKKIEEGGYLPVLVITAQPDHKQRALEAGAKDFVSKPFDLAELRARVHNILEVRLLHLEAKKRSTALEETVRELEANREIIRLKTLAEHQKAEAELTLAQETQESLLPRVLPQLEDYHIHAYSHPTRYVGGDFYDFVLLDAGEWVGILADVSGKGMPAALLSSMVLGALNAEFRAGTPPEDVLNRVNRLLCEKSLPFQFVTLFLFRLNPQGVGQFISAGHNPTYLFRSATGRIEKLASDAYFLGMFDFATYPSRPLHLGQGDILVVYTDGLTDAENRLEEMFGEERLRDIIRHQAPLGSSALQRSLLKAIGEFTQDRPPIDDITFLVVEKCGPVAFGRGLKEEVDPPKSPQSGITTP